MKKTYELPISKNYVHTWGIEDAIREIMQNAIDSQTDGNDLSISYNSGILTITNKGCDLDVSRLVLGSSGKNDITKYIGTYGEGFKLALIVLIRNNIDVQVYTNGQIWKPEFRKSLKFKIETLHIDVYQALQHSGIISFELKGIDYETFNEIRNNNLAILKAMSFNIGEIIETDYGNILLDSKYKGKMFVNGLFIQTDSSFQYGYDFKPEYLQLDRDRKAINYYKMRELTAKAVTSQNNVKLVRQAMQNSYVDVRDVINHMNEITQEFKVNFANEFLKSHDLDENTFVGLKKEVLVSKKEKTFEVDSIAIAQLVNSGLGKDEEYQEIKKRVNNLTKKEEAEEYYQGSDFEKLLEYLCECKDSLNVDDLVAQLKDLTDLHTYNFHLIEEEVWSMFYE